MSLESKNNFYFIAKKNLTTVSIFTPRVDIFMESISNKNNSNNNINNNNNNNNNK